MKIYHFSARTNSEFIRADIDTFTDGTLSREGKKRCKTQYKINIFHIHTNKLQLASGEPPASALYIYIHVYHMYVYRDYACIKCDVGLRMATCCTSQKKTRVMSRKVLNMLQCNLCEITIRNIQ